MKSRLIITAAVWAMLLAGPAAGEYDFFANARYPGPIRKPGVDLYKVKQAGGSGSRGGSEEVVEIEALFSYYGLVRSAKHGI